MTIIRNGVQLSTVGTTDYNQLSNKPTINGQVAQGSITIDATSIIEVTSLPTSGIKQDKLYKMGNKLYWYTGTAWVTLSDTQGVSPKSGTGITVTADGTVNHNVAVTPQTVGSATVVPQITFDAQGHITAVNSITIYPPTTSGSNGQYWKSDGAGAGVWQSPGSVADGNNNLVTGGTVYDYIQDHGGSGAKVTLNGSETDDAKFYAPTSGGTTGQFLMSKGDGSAPVWTDSAASGLSIKDVYPVGSIYMTVNEVNPNTLFAGTSWVQLKDRFLLGAGDTYTGGNTGGSASQNYTPAGANSGTAVTMNSFTIANSNLPAHTHDVTAKGTVAVKTNPSFSGTAASGTLKGNSITGASATGAFTASTWSANGWGSSSGTNGVTWTWNYTPAGSISGGSYTFTGTAVTSGNNSGINSSGTPTAITPTTKSITEPTFTGTEATINTLPPYLVVYMWKRIL